jgi:hypothetical protein
MINFEHRKGQLKIKEMIFMLIFITIFFVIVLLFYLAISSQGLKNSVYQSTKEGAILLVERLADSPELSCGQSLCVDTDKLVILKQQAVYANFWDIDGLVIKKLYPQGVEGNTTRECNSGTYPNCNTYTIKTPANYSAPDETYVSLCRADTKEGYGYQKCELGKIIVYTKKV